MRRRLAELEAVLEPPSVPATGERRTHPEEVNGRDLVILRAARNFRQAEIARAWPCSRQNVARVETAWRPTRAAVDRYLAAMRAAEAPQGAHVPR